ncbi:hypothetical protein [Salicibibacter cibarius]|uniref:hypothetical protein n=1 Tax=Salicibibacter cibarius TaxID=2743000 RepID=UPI001B7D8C16|nr:hypothetical protein [Salicibibacter cibarius]
MTPITLGSLFDGIKTYPISENETGLPGVNVIFYQASRIIEEMRGVADQFSLWHL